MRLPPGAVTKCIYGLGIAADDLYGGIGATLVIDAGGSTSLPPGAVMNRICGSEIAVGCLDGTIEGALVIDAGGSTGLPHMIQVSAP
jgi:hypothetical protein